MKSTNLRILHLNIHIDVTRRQKLQGILHRKRSKTLKFNKIVQ